MRSLPKRILLLLAVMTMLAGCSFSYSSGKSSDSCKSSSTSSGGSKESTKEAKTNYMNDVSTYTSSAVKGDNADHYLEGLSSIAKRHGITDWERDTATYQAIGNGLKQAGITQDKVEDIYFIPTIMAKEKNSLTLILDSYSS